MAPTAPSDRWQRICALAVVLVSSLALSACTRSEDTRSAGCAAGDLTCLDQQLRDVASREGVEPAVQALEQASARQRLTPAQCHRLAHGIGIAAVDGPDVSLADAVRWTARREPGHLCRAGVSHGAVSELVRSWPDVAGRRLTAAGCEQLRPETAATDCAHGVGHGVAMVVGRSSSSAPARCLELRQDLRDYCWSGLFMERFQPVRSGGPATRASLDACDAVLLPAREACWFQAASARFEEGTLPSNPGRSCQHRLAQAQRSCVRAWATMLTTRSPDDTRGAAAACGRIDPEHHTACIEGVATSLLGDGLAPEGVVQLCHGQVDEAVRRACTRWVQLASTGAASASTQ